MKTKVNSNSSIFILPCVILGIGLSIFYFYQTLDSNLERIFIIVAGLMILIPILPSLINMSVRNLLNYKSNGNKRPRTTIDNQGNIIKPKTTSVAKNNDKEGTDTKTEKKYKTKICTTKGYSDIKEMIIKASQNKEMDRECVINLVEEIDGLLGIHRRLYDTMKFTNDFHEIYTKLKSSKLVEEDYEYLFAWLNCKLGKK